MPCAVYVRCMRARACVSARFCLRFRDQDFESGEVETSMPSGQSLLAKTIIGIVVILYASKQERLRYTHRTRSHTSIGCYTHQSAVRERVSHIPAHDGDDCRFAQAEKAVRNSPVVRGEVIGM